MIQFDEAVNKVGADPMRYLFCSRPVSVNMRFSYNLAEQAARKIADLWNIYVFLVNYAILDKPDLSQPVPPETLQVTDRWLLARTAEMIDDVERGYDSWDTPAVIRDVEAYLDDVSNWYVRVSRRRFWRDGHDADKRAAYSTLLAALRSTVLALSPIIPFVTERIWQNAVRGLDASAAESVHHADWPSPPAEWRNEPLLRQTEVVRNVVRLGLKLRAQAQVRVRQPLPALYVFCPEEHGKALTAQLEVIKAELNVKEIKGAQGRDQFFIRHLRPDYKTVNAQLRRDAARFRAAVEALDAEALASLTHKVEAEDAVYVPGFDQPVESALFRIEKKPDPRYGVAEEGDLLVALDLTVNDALKREGLVRDLVRNLQVGRKDAGLSVSQRIELGLATEDETIREAICEHRDYIMDELLATSLDYGVLDPFQAKVDVPLDGSSVLATFRW